MLTDHEMLRPLFDIFVRRMSSAAGSKVPLHQSLEGLAWLLGRWKGHGCGIFPNISPFTYEEEVEFDHVGQPMINYRAKSWNPENGKPMHLECGFFRVKPGTSTAALVLAQNTGVTEVHEGEFKGNELQLTSHSLGRLSFGSEPVVHKTERTYKLNDPDTMEFILSMETTTAALQKHLHITYKKIKED